MEKLSIRKVISIITPRESNEVICCIQHKPVNFLLIFDLLNLKKWNKKFGKHCWIKIFIHDIVMNQKNLRLISRFQMCIWFQELNAKSHSL